MRKAATLGVIAALGMSSTAFAAEGVSYTFVEGGYGYSELVGGQVDGDGYRLGASLELPANFIVSASYRDFSYGSGFDADISETSAGLGYKWGLGDSFDFIGSVSYEKLEIDGSGESGFGLGVGTRGRVSDNVELSAGLQYVDIKTVPSTFTMNAGVRRYFGNPALSVALDVRKAEIAFISETTFIASVRYDFGKLFN
jgi:long-subunit fatty acid transport protein